MQPTSFSCSRCGAPLGPGTVQCPNCGLTFDAPVPASAVPGYAPPIKKGLPVPAIIAIVAGIGCLPIIILAAILVPVFSQVRDKARIVSSEQNLRIVGYAALQYAQNHDEKLPPMDSMDHFKAAVNPYVIDTKGADPFIEPGANIPYKLNAALSRKAYASIPDVEKTEMAREAEPHPGGKIVILYADGHVTVTGPGGEVETKPASGSDHAEE